MRQYKWWYDGIMFRCLIYQFYIQEGSRKCCQKNTVLCKGRLWKHKGYMVHHMWKEQRLSWHREQTELKPDYLHRWIHQGKCVSSKSGLSIAQSFKVVSETLHLIRMETQATTETLEHLVHFRHYVATRTRRSCRIPSPLSKTTELPTGF